MQLSALQTRLVGDWQRGFPLVSRPYKAIASAIGATEGEVIEALCDLEEGGALSRVGAAVRPNSAGASTLAAMAVPASDVARAAAVINAEAGVNHNYEREHEFNLWFVVTGRDRASVSQAISRIGRASGYDVLDLPLEKPYFIDLGFSLSEGEAADREARAAACEELRTPSDAEMRVLCGLEKGLPLAPEPYAQLAGRLGLTEAGVIAALRRLVEGGVISRLGLIVRHRELGYKANAMVVWDIPDGEVDDAGELFARQPFVTLCYRRPRRPPWRYNLFCMIHGRERDIVLDQVARLRALIRPSTRSAVLFSCRCFKQRGARFSAA